MQALSGRVATLLAEQRAAGLVNGVQVAAYLRGREVLSVCAGTMGPRDERPVAPDTLFPSFSTTKGPTALLVHLLADRGLIDYRAPVARYWPAFAQAGKERVTVEQAMSHQAGLHAVRQPWTLEAVVDWQGNVDYLAAATPAWEPGTAVGYHAMTYGWIAGAILEGASGKRLQQLLLEEIAAPLGIESEFYVGIPEDQAVEARLARLANAPVRTDARSPYAGLPPDADYFKAMPVVDWSFNDLRIRRAVLPAANGHFTARALARMYGALANGGEVEGVRLTNPARIDAMRRLVTDAYDRVLLRKVPRAIGFMLGGRGGPIPSMLGPDPRTFGHSGAGGSVAWADPESGLAVAVCVNLLHASSTTPGPAHAICGLIRECVAEGAA